MISQPVETRFIIDAYAEISLAGRRNENQDRLGRFHSSFGEIFLLADGIGGSQCGAIAAELAIRQFPIYLRNLERTLPVRDALQEAARLVNREIYAKGRGDFPALARMGTTLAAAVLCLNPGEGELIVANAGDSRAYLWRNGVLQQYTRDHTVASQLAEAGLLEAHEAAVHPESHVLTRALGHASDISLHVSPPIPIQTGDIILLCSDGLSAYLEEREIGEILASTGDADLVVRRLADAAFDRGSKDNISILYVRVAESVSGMQIGAVLGQYRLERFLGAGGMAQVWLGRHVILNKLAAIKILQPGFGSAAELRERFLQEGEKQAGLEHPAIVRVDDYREDPIDSERLAYLVLQYIDGESLGAKIERQRILDDEFSGIADRILDALEFAHQHQLIHRDVKSSNILLDQAGNAYLGDFGLVVSEDNAGRITQVTRVMGTSENMSPEHILKPKTVDRRADVYSLGCVLYEMLTGQTPFFHLLDDFSIKVAHIKTAPRPIRSLNKKVSAAVEAVVLRALEKDPADRWQSCGEFREALAAASERGVFPRPLQWKLRRFVAKYRPVLAAVVVAIAALAIAIPWRNSASESRQLAAAHSLATSSEQQYKVSRTKAAVLALESIRVRPTQQGENALQAALTGLGRPLRMFPAAYSRELAWSPDSRRLVSISPKGDLEILDPQSGKTLVTLEGTATVDRGLNTIAWSPSGHSIAAFGDNYVGIWNAESGKIAYALKGHTDKVTSVVWSPDGAMLASGSRDKTIRIWDGNSGRLLHTVTGSYAIFSLAWNPNPSHRELVSSGGNAFTYWSTESWANRQVFNESTDTVVSLVWSPDGERLAVTHMFGPVQVIDSDQDRRPFILPGTQQVLSTSWSKDGKRLAVTSLEGTVNVWDVEHTSDLDEDHGHILDRLEGLSGDIDSVAWSPDGTEIAAASDDGSIGIWAGTDNPLARPIYGLPAEVRSLAWSLDGTFLTTVTLGRFGRVWDAASGAPVAEFDATSQAILSADGNRLIEGFSGVKISSAAGIRVLQPPDAKEELLPAAWSADGRVVAYRNMLPYEHPSIQIRSGEDGKLLKTLAFSADHLALSPDGTRLFADSKEHALEVYDTLTAGLVKRLMAPGPEVWSAAWSPDGRYLAVGFADGTAGVWEPERGRRLYLLRTQSGKVSTISWSVDGRRLVSGSADGTVRVWSAAGGEILRVLAAHESLIYAAALSKDGKLATAAVDGLVKIWTMDRSALESHACEFIFRNLTIGEWSSFSSERPYHRTCPDSRD